MQDIAAVFCFVFISLAFYGIRSRPEIFFACSLLLIGAFFIGSWGKWNANEVIAFTGLFLYSFGLLVVRVMMKRSVSLLILQSIRAGTPISLETAFQSRLKESQRQGLVVEQDSILKLTASGRLVAGLISAFYRIFGIVS